MQRLARGAAAAVALVLLGCAATVTGSSAAAGAHDLVSKGLPSEAAVATGAPSASLASVSFAKPAAGAAGANVPKPSGGAASGVSCFVAWRDASGDFATGTLTADGTVTLLAVFHNGQRVNPTPTLAELAQ